MTLEAHSGDETDGCTPDGQPRYAIVGVPWRAQRVTTWLRTIDRIHLSTHFKDNGRATPGAFPRYRIPTRRTEHKAGVVKGLPHNFYDASWLEALAESEVEELGMQSDLELSHTPAIQQ